MACDNEELLNYLVETGMIDMLDVQEQLNMKKRKTILKEHEKSIWYNEKANRWYCYIPDPSKASGRRLVKRKNRKDVEDQIIVSS